jgi:DUF4097 and DUF4098 domain-containing protein YvlB
MKRINLIRNATLIFPFVLLSLAAFIACDVRVIDADDNVANTNFFAAESFSFEIAVKNQTRLKLNAINGPVDVIGVAGATTAKIFGERRVESESEADAKAHLKELEVRVADRQDEISVNTIQPDNAHGRNYKVIYHLRLPNTWKFNVDHVNGIVTIDSLKNDVSVKVVNGSVQLSEIFGNVTAELVNGQLTGKLWLPVQGTCKITTVNGQILLAIPKTTTADFSAAVTNGDINLSNLPLQNSVSTPKSLRGKLGDGQGTISLSTVNGNIGVSGF